MTKKPPTSNGEEPSPKEGIAMDYSRLKGILEGEIFLIRCFFYNIVVSTAFIGAYAGRAISSLFA